MDELVGDRAGRFGGFLFRFGDGPGAGGYGRVREELYRSAFPGNWTIDSTRQLTACVTNRGQWAGFPRGTAVRVVASSTLDLGSDGIDTKQLIEAALATVTEATLSGIQTEFMITDDPDPMPGLNEATGTDHPSPRDTGCAFDRGCVHIQFTEPGSGIMISSRATLRESIQPADAFVHDILGHGIMGMCHIDQELIGGNDKSLMAGGPGAFTGFIPDQLSALDIAAAQAVYGSSLNPGASRAEFVEAGLINP